MVHLSAVAAKNAAWAVALLACATQSWVVEACTQGPSHIFNVERRHPCTSADGAAATTNGATAAATSPLTEHEQVFLSAPNNHTARMNLKTYTNIPHMAGTPGDFVLAEFTRDQMRAFGFESDIEAVDVLLTTPVSRSVRLLSSKDNTTVLFDAALTEDIVPGDVSSESIWRNQTFNGYSPSGTGKGRLVYANYGRPQDFDKLLSMGVNVEGAVVIVRYGECFRGLKAMNAQNRGAVGVLIYSDPFDDGYARGKVYPKGPWRPATSVQRGSIQFNSLCAGDPARAASSENTEEICGYKQEELYPRVPVLPMSYADAEPLLKSLLGPKAPEHWTGALNIDYHIGPSVELVEVSTDNTFFTAPVWNVITRIPGTLAGSEGDRPVVLGNHRDAWVFGAADPNSGSAALLEVGRGMSKALRNGWRPTRSLYLCSWSGEEYGLLGSTAWGEANADSVLKKAVVYLNVDVGVSGRELSVGASASLGPLVADVLTHVKDPDTQQPMSCMWDHKLATLGSGSDYTVFLDRLGIASLDMSFHHRGTPAGLYGTYHSTMDSFEWVTTQADPTMEYHVAMAQIWGLMALRLSSAKTLPFSLTAQAKAIHEYVDVVAELVTKAKDHDQPSTSDVVGEVTAIVVAAATVDLSPLRKAADAFAKATHDFHTKVDALTADSNDDSNDNVDHDKSEGGALQVDSDGVVTLASRTMLRHSTAATAAAFAKNEDMATRILMSMNDKLAFTERQFLAPEGLHKRKWFRHVLQSPGLYLGYAADVFPGVTQALRDGDAKVAKMEVEKAARCIQSAADFVDT